MKRYIIGYAIIWAIGLLLGAVPVIRPYIFCLAINRPLFYGVLITSLIAISCAWRAYIKLSK